MLMHFQQKLQELERRYDQQAVKHDERTAQVEQRLQNLFTQPHSPNSGVLPGPSMVLPPGGNGFVGHPLTDVARSSLGQYGSRSRTGRVITWIRC